MEDERKFKKCKNAFKKSEKNDRIKFSAGLFSFFLICATLLIAIPIKLALVVIPVLLAALFIAFPPLLLYRRIRINGAHIEHYKRRPHKTIVSASSPVFFDRDIDEKLISSLVQHEHKTKNLDQFFEQTNTTAFMVIRDKKILYEKYFNGYTRDAGQATYSITKSIVAALIGIAIDEGKINSVHDPVTEYIPELKTKGNNFSSINIRHLLMMSSGIRYSETLRGDNFWVQFSGNIKKVALRRITIVNPPATCLLYNNLNPTLLGMILERVTGQSISGYLENKIWRPLGMEYSAGWNVDSRFHGFERMHSGLIVRTVDLAKLGQLFLDNGDWRGKRIISESWAKESTRPNGDTACQKDRCQGPLFTSFFKMVPNGYYKYLWWGVKRGKNDYDFLGRGVDAQLLYVCPQKKLIIVRNGKDYGIGTNAWINMCYSMGMKI